jgi:hypothetical protein
MQIRFELGPLRLSDDFFLIKPVQLLLHRNQTAVPRQFSFPYRKDETMPFRDAHWSLLGSGKICLN